MKDSGKKTMNKLIVLIIILAGTLVTFGQEKDFDIKNKTITIEMKKQPLGVVFKYLMKNYDILIGFEGSALDIDHSNYYFETNLSGIGRQHFENKDKTVEIDIGVTHFFVAKKNLITVNAKNERLEDVFNKIIPQMKNYQWEINDSVINIYPIEGRDSRIKKLLETNIKSFNFEKGNIVRTITTNIKELPEFKEFLDESGFYYSGIRTGAVSVLKTQYGKKVNTEMNFSNITFRDLLNKITRVKRGGWIIESHGFSKPVQKDYLNLDI